MRFAGNFHPEWGYLAPAPDFMRTARIVVVATAIGATAGAGVVLSLAGRPAPGPVADAGKALVVVHSLVQPAEAAAPAAPAASPAIVTTPATVPAAAPAQVQAMTQTNVQPGVQANVQASAQPSSERLPAAPPTTAQAVAPAASDSSTTSTPAAPASVAALAEIPPATEASPTQATDDVTVVPDQAAVQKNATKKHRATDHDAQRGPQANVGGPKKNLASDDRGFGSLLHNLFSAHAGTSYYRN
jgi:hypothetical protein